MMSKLLTAITLFLYEYKSVSHVFYFRTIEFPREVREWALVIGGYLAKKGLKNNTVLINGSKIDNHEETPLQKLAYSEWLEKSLKLTGKMEMPRNIDKSCAIILKGKFFKSVSRVA